MVNSISAGINNGNNGIIGVIYRHRALNSVTWHRGISGIIEKASRSTSRNRARHISSVGSIAASLASGSDINLRRKAVIAA
jgi:hypothetical protein